MRYLHLKFLLLLTFFINSAVSASALEAKLEDILLDMEKNDKIIETVKFNYNQEIQYSLTKEKQYNSGEMIFHEPDGFYFKQTSPLEQIIVSNGKKVWVYTPSYKQVIVDAWQRWLKNGFFQNSAIDMKMNWTELRKKYTLEYIADQENCYVLLLSPKSTQLAGTSAVNSWKMKIWLDSKDLKPSRAELIGENITVITRVSDYTVNSKIDKKIFNFKVPEGVEVMKMP